jgi:hypothetical protein
MLVMGLENNLERLAATMYQMVLSERPNMALINGMDVALNHAPNIIGDPDGELTTLIDGLMGLSEEQISQIPPVELDDAATEMFIMCGGGVNLETAMQLREWLYREIPPAS